MQIQYVCGFVSLMYLGLYLWEKHYNSFTNYSCHLLIVA